MILSFSGCTYVPPVNIRSTHVSDHNMIYFITDTLPSDDVDLRKFDLNKSSFVERTKIQGLGNNDYLKIHYDHDRIILSVKKADVRYKQDEYPTLNEVVKDGIVSLTGNLNGSIVGMDDNYYYMLKEASIKGRESSSNDNIELMPFRYDKKTKNIIDGHFDRQDIIVIGVSKSGNDIWYTCLQHPIKKGVDVTGKIGLALKPVDNDQIEYFISNENDTHRHVDNIALRKDTMVTKDAVWITTSDRIIEFSRSTKQFFVAKVLYSNPVLSNQNEVEANYYWMNKLNDSSGENYFYKINDDTFKAFMLNKLPPDVVIKLPDKYHKLQAIYFDGKYFWMLGDKMRAISLNIRTPMKYLVKINKDDPNDYTPYLLEPSIYEAITSVIGSFMFDVFGYPILAITGFH